jgi:hypothetical protein
MGELLQALVQHLQCDFRNLLGFLLMKGICCNQQFFHHFFGEADVQHQLLTKGLGGLYGLIKF